VSVERYLKSTVVTLTGQFYVDGVLTDPSPATATIGITRADGTALIAPGTATTRTGLGTFQYSLSAAQTALLDNLTARWTSSLGTVETYGEIVGGFLFTIAEARAFGQPLSDAAKYSSAQIAAVRTLAEQALEDACGVAFVPRHAHELVSATGNGLVFKWPRVLAVLTVNGVAPTGTVDIYPSGVVTSSTGWPSGRLAVAYDHGYERPPERVKRAAILLAKRYIVNGPIDDRASKLDLGDQGSIALFNPMMRDSVFDVPEAEACVRAYGGFSVGIG
jgi:hypothetical protein